ncbi:MAG: hypothetical protein Q4G51_17625 [Dermatophilus congolensis]|nr:hypothetical protein [Dermatophilus congolensis]
MAAVALAGCGLTGIGGGTATVTETATPGPTNATTPEASPTATATTPTTSPSAPDPTEVSTLPGGNGMALPLLLSDNFLPAAWTSTTPRDSGGFRMTICGVDIEPREPIDGAAKRWQQTPTGPFLEQHVRVYGDSTARDVLAALKEAMPGCREYTATDAKGGSSTFTVSSLTLRSADRNTIQWRQKLVPTGSAPTSEATTTSSTLTPGAATPTGTVTATSRATAPTPPTLTQDVVVARIGSSTVMLVSYAVGTNPSAALLDAALSAAKTLP